MKLRARIAGRHLVKWMFTTGVVKKTCKRMRAWVNDASADSTGRTSPPPPQSLRPTDAHLALVAGHFSTTDHQATFGDTEAMRVVMDWLEEAGIAFDVACHPQNGFNGLDLDTLNPKPYTLFIFVCGPWSGHKPLLERFAHCTRIGIDLSVKSKDHGFDILIPRNFFDVQNPDLVLASKRPGLPLAGIARVHPQPAYGDRQRHQRTGEVLDRYLAKNEVSAFPLDTLWHKNPTLVRSATQFESLIQRCDVVISTRLHGMVFALKNGTPVVAIDPIAGGSKVTAQALALEWPLIFSGEDVTEEQIQEAVRKCLNGSMDKTIQTVQSTASENLKRIKESFLQELSEINVLAKKK